jgi:hypothetical protein
VGVSIKEVMPLFAIRNRQCSSLYRRNICRTDGTRYQISQAIEFIALAAEVGSVIFCLNAKRNELSIVGVGKIVSYPEPDPHWNHIRLVAGSESIFGMLIRICLFVSFFPSLLLFLPFMDPDPFSDC